MNITSNNSNPSNSLRPKRRGVKQRYWSIETKRRIVEETFEPGVSVASVARKHDANTNVVFRWRREYRRGDLGPQRPDIPADEGPGFVEVGIVGGDGRLMLPGTISESNGCNAPAATPSTYGEPSPNRISLELPGSIRMCFDAGIEPDALRRLIRVVKEFA
jgi:transposase